MSSKDHVQKALDGLGIGYTVDADYFHDGMSERVDFLVRVPGTGNTIALRKRDDRYETLASSRVGIDTTRFTEILHRQYVFEITTSSMSSQGFIIESDTVNDVGDRVVVYVEAAR